MSASDRPSWCICSDAHRDRGLRDSQCRHDEIEARETRIAELTVPQPMSTAPKDETRILISHREGTFAAWWLKSHQAHILEGWYLLGSATHLRESSLLGWLPLPEMKSTD